MIRNPGLLYHLKLIFLLLKPELPEEKFRGLGPLLEIKLFSPSDLESAHRAGNSTQSTQRRARHAHHAVMHRSTARSCPNASQHAATGDVKLKAGLMHEISNLLLSFWSSRFLPSLSLLVSLIFFVLEFLHRDNFLLDYFWGVGCMDTHWPLRDGTGIPVRVVSIGGEKEGVSCRGGVLYRAGLHRLEFIIIPLQATGGHSSTNSYGSYRVLKNVSAEHGVSVLISPQHLAAFKFLLIMWQKKS